MLHSGRNRHHRLAAQHRPRAMLRTVVSGLLENISLRISYISHSEDLPGPSDSAFLQVSTYPFRRIIQLRAPSQILVLRIGKPGALFLWVRRTSRASPIVLTMHRHSCASPHSSYAKRACRRARARSTRSRGTTGCPTATSLGTSRLARARRCAQSGLRRC